jgi:hypothetical protein
VPSLDWFYFSDCLGVLLVGTLGIWAGSRLLVRIPAIGTGCLLRRRVGPVVDLTVALNEGVRRKKDAGANKDVLNWNPSCRPPGPRNVGKTCWNCPGSTEADGLAP